MSISLISVTQNNHGNANNNWTISVPSIAAVAGDIILISTFARSTARMVNTGVIPSWNGQASTSWGFIANSEATIDIRRIEAATTGTYDITGEMDNGTFVTATAIVLRPTGIITYSSLATQFHDTTGTSYGSGPSLNIASVPANAIVIDLLGMLGWASNFADTTATTMSIPYTLTSSSFAALADGFTVPSAAYAALTGGQTFTINGFANSGINGTYVVGSKEAANKIVTTVAPVATEAAGASVTLTTGFAVAGSQLNTGYPAVTRSYVATSTSTGSVTAAWTSSAGSPMFVHAMMYVQADAAGLTIDSAPTDIRVTESRTIRVTAPTTAMTTGNTAVKINSSGNSAITPSAVTNISGLTYDVVFTVTDEYAGLPYNATGYGIIVTTTDGSVTSANIPFLPVTGNDDIVLTDVSATDIESSPALEVDDQVEWTNAAVITIGADGKVSSLSESATFEFRVWDHNDSTWGDWAEQTWGSGGGGGGTDGISYAGLSSAGISEAGISS